MVMLADNLKIIRRRKQFLTKMLKYDGLLVVDTETTDLNPYKRNVNLKRMSGRVVVRKHAEVFCIGICDEDFNTCFVRVEEKELWRLMKRVLESDNSVKIMHNAIFDMRALAVSGIHIPQAIDKFECSFVLSKLALQDVKSHSLEWLTECMLEEESPWKQELKDFMRSEKAAHTREGKPEGYVNYSFLPYDFLQRYTCLDCFYTMCIWKLLVDNTDDWVWDIYNKSKEVMPICVEMEKIGAFVNPRETKKMVKELLAFEETAGKYISRKLHMGTLGKFKLGSHVKLRERLLKLGLTRRDLTHKEKVGTGNFVLFRASRKGPKWAWLEKIHAVRLSAKLRKTYFGNFINLRDEKDAIHPNYQVEWAVTGRLSCRDPNIQNVTRDDKLDDVPIRSVRSVFIKRPGWRNFYLDYSQMELRRFADHCQEEKLLEAFANDEDIHQYVALLMFGEPKDEAQAYIQRKRAKLMHYAILYGMGVKSFALNAKLTIKRAKNVFTTYYDRFPAVLPYLKSLDDQIRSLGYVEDIFGRRHYVPRKQAYKSVNHLIQGECAGVLLRAMVRVDSLLKTKRYASNTFMIMSIHDELVFQSKLPQGPKQERMVREIRDTMEDYIEFDNANIELPVDCEYSDKSWAKYDKKEFKLSA